MGGSESKTPPTTRRHSPPSQPRRENTNEPTYWRGYALNLKTEDWDEETVKRLLRDVVEFAGFKSDLSRDPKLKIILVGHTGSGKSSLINSFIAALTGSISSYAVEGGRDHTTDTFNEIPVRLGNGKYLDLAFYDVRGTGAASAGSTEVDILRAILMKKKLGEKFVPGLKFKDSLGESTWIDENAAHVILYAIDGAAFVQKIEQGEEDQWLPVVLDLKDITDKWNVSRYLVATHMDMVDSELKKNIKAMHTSRKVDKAVKQIKGKTKFPDKNILPVLNPIATTHELENPDRTYFLYLLWQIVHDANSAYENRMYMKGRMQRQQQQD